MSTRVANVYGGRHRGGLGSTITNGGVRAPRNVASIGEPKVDIIEEVIIEPILKAPAKFNPSQFPL